MNDTPDRGNSIRIPPYLKEAATYLLRNRDDVHQQAIEAWQQLDAFLDELPEADAERLRIAIYRFIQERAEAAYQKGLEFGGFLAENQ